MLQYVLTTIVNQKTLTEFEPRHIAVSPLDLSTPKLVGSKGHSLYQVCILCDHSFLSYLD